MSRKEPNSVPNDAVKPPAPPCPPIVQSGRTNGGSKNLPNHPKPDVCLPSQRRLSFATITKESIGEVGEAGHLCGRLKYCRLVHRENVVFFAHNQDDIWPIGRSDEYGKVSGAISGVLLSDGSYDLITRSIEPGAIIRISYESAYELPVEPCDNFGCDGPFGEMVCPECRNEHFILLRKERDDLRKRVADLEEEVVFLKKERDYWEKKYRMS